jgi:hypothetical protein
LIVEFNGVVVVAAVVVAGDIIVVDSIDDDMREGDGLEDVAEFDVVG